MPAKSLINLMSEDENEVIQVEVQSDEEQRLLEEEERIKKLE